MPNCPNCGGHVTRQFLRVFGRNGDEIERCPHCSPDDRINERTIAGLHSIRGASVFGSRR